MSISVDQARDAVTKRFRTIRLSIIAVAIVLLSIVVVSVGATGAPTWVFIGLVAVIISLAVAAYLFLRKVQTAANKAVTAQEEVLKRAATGAFSEPRNRAERRAKERQSR